MLSAGVPKQQILALVDGLGSPFLLVLVQYAFERRISGLKVVWRSTPR